MISKEKKEAVINDVLSASAAITAKMQGPDQLDALIAKTLAENNTQSVFTPEEYTEFMTPYLNMWVEEIEIMPEPEFRQFKQEVQRQIDETTDVEEKEYMQMTLTKFTNLQLVLKKFGEKTINRTAQATFI